MNRSRDGFSWTQSEGRSEGLPTIGVVSPTSWNSSNPDEFYDAIVIGAGFAGLVASRDLATQGKKTLLLEARDRLGGRTWNATIDGFNYELGGTWLHWHMPHIYREISLYGLHNDWVVTQNGGSKYDFHTLTSDSAQQQLTHKEESDMFNRVWGLFCNADEAYLRENWRYAFGTGQSPQLTSKWDQLSCQDRLEQIRDQLTAPDMAMLVSLLQQMGGADLRRMGYLNALHWWVLGGHTSSGLNDIALHTRLGSGTSTLHRRIFEHALATGNLSYSFATAVDRIQDTQDIVRVTSKDNRSWRARAVICTTPLNVLNSVMFDPPLPADKVEAAREGSVNKCNKIHVDLAGPDYLSWSSFASPGQGFVCGIGDKLTPAGDSHLVAFGPDPAASNGINLKDLEAVQKAVLHLLPKEKRGEAHIRRIVSHDWNTDQFSRGTWCYLPPNFITKHLEALQRPHGNVHFASADWSDGWRGWVDGACQIGMQAAATLIESQRTQPAATWKDSDTAEVNLVANGTDKQKL